jgi:tripartite-type tricarboxylate transporter receptor subunit TctC
MNGRFLLNKNYFRAREEFMQISTVKSFIASAICISVLLTSTFAVGADTFPQKGKIITMIIPYNPGGSTDTEARIIAPLLENFLKTPVQVLNKPGARTQIAMGELASSKPDGYTLLFGSFPGGLIPAVDPETPAPYTMKDFVAVSSLSKEPFAFSVQKSSPYKSMKDVMDYVKANPEKFKVAVPGLLMMGHLSLVNLERTTGTKFAAVTFDGTAPGRTALLGGHVDGLIATVSETNVAVKADLAVILGIMDDESSPEAPGVKTMPEQGLDFKMAASQIVLAPAGLPAEVMGKLEDAFQGVSKNESYIQRMKAVGNTMSYRNAKESQEYILQLEKQIKPAIEQARKEQKK